MPTVQRIVTAIEDLDFLDPIARPVAALVLRLTSSDAVKNTLSGTWLGHPLHPLLTDVPIGLWVSASAMDLVGGRKAARRKAARRLSALGILAAIPTAASGLSDWSDTYGPEQRVGLVHAVGNVTGLLFQVASYWARRRRPVAGAVLGLTGVGVAAASGYLGGHLSFVRGVGVSHTAFEGSTNEWAHIGLLTEFAVDKPRRATAGGIPIVVVRHGESIWALSATCTHAGGPLDEGSLIDGCIRCPWHGSTFRLADGRVERGPASVAEPAWEVRVDNGNVLVRSN